MTDRSQDVRARDDAFFASLLTADVKALREILTDDFLIVDVMAGQVAGRDDLLGAMSTGELRFVDVTRSRDEQSIRVREGAAVVVGRTRMTMMFRGAPVSVSSRYTHVFARDNDRWRLMSAQGTPIPR